MSHLTIAVRLLMLLLAIVSIFATMASSQIFVVTIGPAVPSARTNSFTGQTDCDGVGSFICPTGTCFTGYDGYIGCCSVSSCNVRTTCMPYTASAIQSCEPNQMGCLLCGEMDPYCVTVTNVVAKQHIMYCDTRAQGIVTYSYTNLATTGSMALPPSVAMTLSPKPSASNMPPGASRTSSDLGSSITTSTNLGAAASETGVIVPVSTGPSMGTTIGAAVGAVSGIIAIFLIVFFLVRKRRKDRLYKIYEKSSADNNGILDPELHQSHSEISQRMQPTTRDSVVIARTFANNENDFLSPIQRDQLARINEARDAACVHEIDSTPSTANFPASKHDDISAAQKKDWWKPPNCMAGEPNPSSRWSVSNAPGAYRSYQPNANNDQVSELASIRHVPSRGERPRPATPIDALNIDGISPLIGEASPFVGGSSFPSPIQNSIAKDKIDSVGVAAKPASLATVQTPLRWPDTQHLQTFSGGSTSKNAARPVSTGSGVNRALTSANGGGNRWISAETAMAGGFSACQDNTSDQDMENSVAGKQ